MTEITAIYIEIYDNVFLVYLIRKEKFPVRETKLVCEASLRFFLFAHFAKLLIRLVVTTSHLFSFCIYQEHGQWCTCGGAWGTGAPLSEY